MFGMIKTLTAKGPRVSGHPPYTNSYGISIRLSFLLALALLFSPPAEGRVIREGLLVDLNADHDVLVEDGLRVKRWSNQVSDEPVRHFVRRNKGRNESGSGRPTLQPSVNRIGNHNAIVFKRDELVNHNEDAFDHLTTGSGYTWITVLAPLEQKTGLEDVNSFFGNLRNGGNYEGFWAGLEDDNTLWAGTRNGRTFGRWDQNNPKLVGPTLQTNRFYVIAGRMQDGTKTAEIDLFVNGADPVQTKTVPINADANPSKLAIGQERDAIEHPGRESFDGKITRFLLYERPLNDTQLKQVIHTLRATYRIKDE